jgi:photosystem II stability/assembly factor-like uncharacterized protein
MKILFPILLFFILFMNSYSQQGWVMQNSEVSSTLRHVVFYNGNTGLAAGDGGTIIRTTNGGANWSPVSSGTTQTLYSITFSDSQVLYACGAGGTIIKSTDSGLSWTVLNSGTTAALRTIHATPTSLYGIYTAGDNGTILYSTNGGANWQIQSSGTTARINRLIYFYDGVSGYITGAVGNSGTALNAVSGTWQQEPNFPSTTQDILYLSSSVIGVYNVLRFACTNTGSVLRVRTTMQLGTWTMVSSGVTSPLRSVAAAYGSASNRVWAVGDSGVVRYSADTGSTWRQQTLNTSSNLLNIFVLDSLRSWIVGENGLVAVTVNGGVGITNISSEAPSSFSLSQNYPNPFNPTTDFEFSIPPVRTIYESPVKLAVYNSLGKEIAVLVNGPLKAGIYRYSFDGTGLNSGVYFYRLTAGRYSETKRMVLVK